METIDLRNKLMYYIDVINLLIEIKSEIMKEENGRMDIISYIEDKIRTLENIDKYFIVKLNDEKKRYME